MRLVLLTDDNFLGDVLGSYMVRDGIDVERVSNADQLAREIAAGADGVLVDLAKRGVTGDAVMQIALRAHTKAIPFLIASAQPRRDLVEFAAVIRATDVVSKTERMTTIAARIRLCLQTPVRVAREDGTNAFEFAFA